MIAIGSIGSVADTRNVCSSQHWWFRLSFLYLKSFKCLFTNDMFFFSYSSNFIFGCFSIVVKSNEISWLALNIMYIEREISCSLRPSLLSTGFFSCQLAFAHKYQLKMRQKMCCRLIWMRRVEESGITEQLESRTHFIFAKLWCTMIDIVVCIHTVHLPHTFS